MESAFIINKQTTEYMKTEREKQENDRSSIPFKESVKEKRFKTRE